MPGALGEFEQMVLWAVLRLGEGAYGVEIRREIARQTGRDVAAGAVYTTLGRLEGRGLVTSRPGAGSPERTGQRRKYYRLEPEGARALHRSHSDLQRMANGMETALAGLAARGRDRTARS